MSKSRPFSIFLLKEGCDASNSLNEEHDLEKSEAKNLPKDATLYVLDAEPKPPWWRSYFDIEEELWQEHTGALVFLPVGGRCFALSFGQVFHHLKDTAYEYDFGLRVTLNCLDPRELKSADMVAPGPALRKRTQVPVSTELTFLDFDGNSEIIKSLTGKVKAEYAELFKNATGSVALKVSLKLEPNELAAICETLLELYGREDFKESFPNIQNIAPVKDPSKIAELDEILLNALKTKSGTVTLTIPDIIDYRDNTCCVFEKKGMTSGIYPDITLEYFYDFLGEEFDLDSLTIDLMHDFRMNLTDIEGKIARPYSLYRALLCDAQINGEQVVYHLCEGSWYKAELAFLVRLTSYLDQKCATADLCPYNHDVVKGGKAIYSEENYNRAVPAWDDRFICLDQTNISPTEHTQIEPCDLYSIEDDPTVQSGHRAKFYHLKISTRSSHLSHLFNQGINAVELIQLEETSKEKLKQLIIKQLNKTDQATYISPLDTFDFKVIFGVITHKDGAAKSANLPLFSRISLMRIMQRLDLMKIPSLLTFVPDESPKKDGYSKYPFLIVHVAHLYDGTKEVHVSEDQGEYTGRTVTRCPKEIREAEAGMQYRVMIKETDNGELTTFHKWPYSRVI